MVGVLAPKDSTLDIHFETGALESFKDFIDAIREAGYGAVWHGQKGFNGVAVLAKGTDPVERQRGGHDAGGAGREVSREVLACPACAARERGQGCAQIEVGRA